MTDYDCKDLSYSVNKSIDPRHVKWYTLQMESFVPSVGERRKRKGSPVAIGKAPREDT